MSIDFSVEPVDEKPKKKGGGRRGSKYAPIIARAHRFEEKQKAR